MSRLNFLLGALGLSLGHHHGAACLDGAPRFRPVLKPEDHQTSHGRWRGRKPACECCGVTLGRDYYCRNRMCDGYMLRNPKPRDYSPGYRTEGDFCRRYGVLRQMRPAKAYAPIYCRWCGHRISYQTYSAGECTKCKRSPVGYARAIAAGGSR